MLELVKERFIFCDNYNGDIYFTVLAHFATLPKSEAVARRVKKELSELPEGLVTKLSAYGIRPALKVREFVEPTPEEVSEYCLTVGHKVDGRQVVEFYRNQAEKRGKKGYWYDSKGKLVIDWKRKVRSVWCRDENKLKAIDGAPKGYEYFHIYVDGVMVFPDAWKGGKPFSRNIAMNKKLKEEYENKNI